MNKVSYWTLGPTNRRRRHKYDFVELNRLNNSGELPHDTCIESEDIGLTDIDLYFNNSGGLFMIYEGGTIVDRFSTYSEAKRKYNRLRNRLIKYQDQIYDIFDEYDGRHYFLPYHEFDDIRFVEDECPNTLYAWLDTNTPGYNWYHNDEFGSVICFQEPDHFMYFKIRWL